MENYATEFAVWIRLCLVCQPRGVLQRCHRHVFTFTGDWVISPGTPRKCLCIDARRFAGAPAGTGLKDGSCSSLNSSPAFLGIAGVITRYYRAFFRAHCSGDADGCTSRGPWRSRLL